MTAQNTQPETQQEGVSNKRPIAMMDMTDNQLVRVANKWISEAKPLHDKMVKVQTRNENYWAGEQLDFSKLDDYQARIILNKVFQSMETMIPRTVSRIPAPVVSVPVDEDADLEQRKEARQHATRVEKLIIAQSEHLKLRHLLEEFVRFFDLHHLGVLKFGYDEEENAIWVENIRAPKIFLPPDNSKSYVIEFKYDTVEYLADQFGDEYEGGRDKLIQDVLNLDAPLRKQNRQNLGDGIGYYEITTDKMKFWKVNDILLGKEKNRYYDFENKSVNHWTKPRKDYIFSDIWSLGKTQYSQSTLTSQIIPLQDSLNKRKRQISDNADRANGILVAYGESGITKEEASAMEKSRKRPDSVVFSASGAPGGVQQFHGQRLEQYVFDDMIHTINEVDNVYGTHATTRGERTPGEETFGGRQLLKEADQERIATMVEMVERVAEELYNAFAQIIKVSMDEKAMLPYLGADGSSELVRVNKKLITEGLRINVKPGTTLIKDKAALAQEAVVLWQNKAIDPVTLYERLGDPTPFKTAERFFKWSTNPASLFEEVADDMDKAKSSENETMVKQSVVQAGAENKALLAGKPVPPYRDVTPQHMAVHQDAFSGELPPDPAIRSNIQKHIAEELEILKKNTESMQSEEGVDMVGKMSV